MATIRDVAKSAGVSVATVSAVINSNSKVKVSEELRRRVEKAIKELNYKPNRIARALSKNDSQIIAYVVPSITNRFFSQLAKYIEDMACEKNYSIYLCNTDGKTERVKLYTKNLIENRVSGIISTLTWELTDSSFIKEIDEANIPIVGLAGARESEQIDTVITDDEEGGRIATEYLIKKGHTNIGFIGLHKSRTTKKRLKGYFLSLKKFDLPIKKTHIELGTEFTREGGYILAENMLKRCPEITAIFVYNDEMASGVIDKLHELGIRVPQEMAVMGFDDSVAEYVKPKLTTMVIPKQEMAKIAMELLFERINKKEKISGTRHIKVLPELVERDSV